MAEPTKWDDWFIVCIVASVLVLAPIIGIKNLIRIVQE